MKEITDHPERLSAKLAEAGFSERELQKFTVLEVLPFRLEAVLDSISGLRFDPAAAAEAEAAGNSAGTSDNLSAADSTEPGPVAAVAPGRAAEAAAVAARPLAAADMSSTAVAETQQDTGGSTLLIVMYQQDESQRAQYYALPL
ncbi:hypothetical protein D3C75_947950 [compost metagenome]